MGGFVGFGFAVGAFEFGGHTVQLAADGRAGLKAALSHQPDLIVLDIMLPGISGFDVCRQVRSDAATAKIPVLFLSGHTETEIKLAGFAVGGQDYVTKPFVEAEVLARASTAAR